MDIFDRAQEHDELFRSNALKNQQAKAARLGIAPYKNNRRAGTPNKNCSDCGEPIPKGRLKANPQATRCITCQILAERRGNDDE